MKHPIAYQMKDGNTGEVIRERKVSGFDQKARNSLNRAAERRNMAHGSYRFHVTIVWSE